VINVGLKTASILPAIIVITVVLAGGAILLTQLAPTDQKVDDQQRIQAEADQTMRQAIALGINDWMMNGFSNQNKVWYATGSIPPDFTEAKNSLNEMVNLRVQEYMDRLRSENEKYYINPDVVVSFDVAEPLADDLTALKAGSQEFKVGLETSDQSQIADISDQYSYPYKSWLIYTKMNEWMSSNADQITQSLHDDALLAKPCQLMTGGCDCAQAEFSNASIEGIKLNQDAVTPVLDARVKVLNDALAGQGVNCGYQIEMMNIQNTEKITWTTGDAGPNKTTQVQPRPSDYTYVLERWEDEERTRPKGDECDGLPQLAGGTNVPASCTVRDVTPISDGTVSAYTEPDPDDNEDCQGFVTRMGALGGGGANLAQTMKIGMLAMDKKLALLMTVYCEDPNQKVESDTGLRPMRAEIRMRVAIALDCPIPSRTKDIYMTDKSLYAEDPGTCPGGSCFPAGTMISMADGSKKPIETVKVGDSVMSYNTYSGEFRPGTVLELESPVREGLFTIAFADASSIQVTNEHPFYVTKADGSVGWASIMPEETYKETKTIDHVMPLVVGDSIMRQDKSWAKVVSISYNEGKVKTYNLKEVSGYDNFFAENLLAHNKCCFAAGTPVTMADGSEKAIEDVKVGDFVMTYNEATGSNEPAEVLELQQPIREGIYVVTFSNGKELRVTNDHPLYVKGNRWAAIEPDAALAGYALSSVDKLVVGSEVMQEDGSYSSVASINYVAGDIQTYTLKKVAKNRNFYANGFLAHNQKMIGFIGLACPITCQPCYGCAPADGVTSPRQEVASDWQCVGPLPNLICGQCGICGSDGSCIPQYAGYPCFDEAGNNMMAGNGANRDYADCYACDGVNTGAAGCVVNPPAIASLIDIMCDGGPVCSRCNGNNLAANAGGCTLPPTQDATCNDGSLADEVRRCQICKANDASHACQADPTLVGEACDDCATCSAAGRCDAPAPESSGNCVSETTPCMKCSDSQAGTCVADLTLNNECPACQMCGGSGGCVADASANGRSCGDCKTCQNGACVAANEGMSCGSENGCTWTCQTGDCRLSNVGASCTLSSNTCGLSQTCSDSGCETQSSERESFCCGRTKCAQGSACCTYTEQCAPCPSTT
jgi:hypothetical protein